MSRSMALLQHAHRHNRPVLLAARISTLFSLRRQRAQLKKLDADALADIGLSHTEALSEANRPFWDVPQNWLR